MAGINDNSEPTDELWFLGKCIGETEGHLGQVMRMLGGHDGPFSVARHDLRDIEQKFKEALALIRAADIVKRREPIDPKAMAANLAAQSDAGFQRFLKCLRSIE